MIVCSGNRVLLLSNLPSSLASSAVTPAGSVHKSRGDNVVCM